jgi:hypothetical protein
LFELELFNLAYIFTQSDHVFPSEHADSRSFHIWLPQESCYLLERIIFS